MQELEKQDPQIYEIIQREISRQNSTIDLIASENFTSLAVIEAMGTVLSNKYSEGYPSRRYYGGNSVIDEVEDIARQRACEVFGAEHGNVQPHSGANANIAAYMALIKPGDTVLGMRLDQGGHLTHGSPVNLSGQLYNFVAYGVSDENEQIDFDEVAQLARKHRPKLIVAGATAYPRIIDPVAFRQIADEVGALFLFDAAHVAGLIAAGQHPNPTPVADVVTFTTHKTLRGPRGGAIVCKEKYAKAIDKAVFPGLQGGPLEHVIAAKAVAFKEALDPSFAQYGAQIVANSKTLANELEKEGFRLVSGGTDNHLSLIDLRSFDPDLGGKQAQEVLDSVGIVCNKNQIPNDPRSPFVTSGLRIGTASVTTTGMQAEQMKQIASLVGKVLNNKDNQDQLEQVRDEVRTLSLKFSPYPELKDK